MEKITKEDINIYYSIESKIHKRCRDIGEYYYNAGLWSRGINYVCGFSIEENKIEIYEGAHGMDLSFNLEDFFDDEKLIKAIEKDIEESK